MTDPHPQECLGILWNGRAPASHPFMQSSFTTAGQHGEVNKSRFRVMGALVSAFLLLAPASLAQTAPATPATSSAVTQSQVQTARVSNEVFQKLRPATIRIEQRAFNSSEEPEGLGTGFFISKDGLALTAYHVVFGAKSLSARTLSGERLPVKVIGYDDANDVALVQVQVKNDVPVIPLATEGPRIGEAVLAIGNGGGQFLRSARGVLRRLDVPVERRDFPSGTLELDAQLIPGDSGGPIINARGEAIGVVSYILVNGERTTREGQQGRSLDISSYAVPMSQGSALLSAMKRGERRDAPVIGIGLTPQGGQLYENLRDDAFPRLGLGPKAGVLFDRVTPNSPAERAGLRPVEIVRAGNASTLPVLRGDVILAVDGTSVRSFLELLNLVRIRNVGETLALTVQRGDQTVQVSVTLAGRAQVQTNPER